MIEVRREEDGELCGFVDERDGRWHALTVFGGVLGEHCSREDAVALVSAEGLASLAERWLLRDAADAEPQVVCIQEADPSGVTVALDHYSLPGVPTRRVSRSELETGGVELFR